jgi:thiosulfate/3-mercaptopyruvate sulfurtransferase
LSPPPGDPGVLVDPDWIEAHLEDPAVRLIEVDVSPAAYDAGHIPGAVFWGSYGDLRDSAYLPVERVELQRLIAAAGVRPETTLVFYGSGATLGFWLMKAQGHGDVRLLAGDREQWPASGREWSTEVPPPATGTYPLASEDERIQASRSRVEAAIGDPAQVLLDVRAEAEFSGERFWPSGASEDAGRAGHLPGAINLPIDRLRQEDGSLKSAERAGVDPEKTVIVYCTIGSRASQAWFGLTQLLGYPDVRVYYASWVEWGKRDDTPVEVD